MYLPYVPPHEGPSCPADILYTRVSLIFSLIMLLSTIIYPLIFFLYFFVYLRNSLNGMLRNFFISDKSDLSIFYYFP